MVNKIKGLDGLRAISVLLVIMSHAEGWRALGVTNPYVTASLSAHTGVSVFFVLSGFLITFLLIKEKQATGQTDIFSFIKRRALRIFPLYYLAILFLMCMDVAGQANIPACSFFFAMTYTVNFNPVECADTTMSHFWSLSVEEHFYLIWPAVFFLGKRTAVIVAAIATIACLTIGTSLYPDTDRFFTSRWTFPAVLPILAGCLLAFVCNLDRVKSIAADKSTSGILLIAVLFGLSAPSFTSTKVVWLLAVCGLVLYIFHNQDSILVRLLEFKPLAAIGVISYGLYVWQGVFTGNGPYRSGAAFPPNVDVGVWLTFVVAPLSYVFFEKPIMRLKGRYSWREGEASTPKPLALTATRE